MGEPRWYTVVAEVATGDGWWPVADPWTRAVECGPGEMADGAVRDYQLAERGGWRVRVYAGYNRFDDLVCERTG